MFKEIDVSRLRNALNTCKDNLVCENSKEIMSNLNSNDIWQSMAKVTFLKGLDKEININYKELTAKINSYLETTNLIEQYQILEKETEDLFNTINISGGIRQDLVNKLEANKRELENLKYKILNSL